MILKFQDPSVILLIGAPGTGKSTFAAKHFADHEILRSDYYRYLISGDENNQAASKGAFKILDLILEQRLKAGKLCVIDATNINPKQRVKLVEAAKKYDKPVGAIVFEVSEEHNLQMNMSRDRVVPEEVVLDFRSRLESVTDEVLAREGVSKVYRINPLDQYQVKLAAAGPNAYISDTGPFDIIGDIHGCYDELWELIRKLGYGWDPNPRRWAHSNGRKLVFVGDLVDRGPDSDGVVEMVKAMCEDGIAYIVASNHDDKFRRYLKGNKVKVGNGLQATIDQIFDWNDDLRQDVMEWLDSIPSHLVLDEGKLVVSHAGLEERYHGRDDKKVKDLAMYGITTGQVDENDRIIRKDIASIYTGDALQVHGHTVTAAPVRRNNVICVDQGCVFGGKLTALRYPEMDIVQVSAQKTYWDRG